MRAIDIYGGKDPREIPNYSAGDAARYLNIPVSTIRSWTVGSRYRVTQGHRKFEPVIVTKHRKPLRLTFINLIEIHVLRAIRQHHKINLGKVRTALDYIDKEFKILYPLAHQIFLTDGVDLFIERYGQLINASEQRQMSLKSAIKAHLERIEPDDKGLAIKLFPFTRNEERDNPRIVAIDPRIAFGRMVIAGTGITTDIIAERFWAGDSYEQLASDYECDLEKIEEAIRCESRYSRIAA
ncbi:DUF433 domain-containing protein [Roseofilum casamattae]|uniref:DUF433 domain-containing protein n=1 Tax=Roseofilum casamattae BLCC-M143 TaxID=3022442 RepID=A0ABT7BZY9_9CYAN|nr:DUF433 domain-containing protein [Roseofilum casamattae]MDJ1184372.1 DUF433 domain-containing protein [Roseofilum casamattae BLCC-M143]